MSSKASHLHVRRNKIVKGRCFIKSTLHLFLDIDILGWFFFYSIKNKAVYTLAKADEQIFIEQYGVYTFMRCVIWMKLFDIKSLNTETIKYASRNLIILSRNVQLLVAFKNTSSYIQNI